MAARWPIPCTNAALINVPSIRENTMAGTTFNIDPMWKTSGGHRGHRHRDKETLIVPLHEIRPFIYAIVDLLRVLRRTMKKENRKNLGPLGVHCSIF